MEIWREIPGFPGNEASNLGRLRTYWYKVRNRHGYGTHRELCEIPRPIPMSIEDNGYFHCNIYCDIDKVRYTRKVHTLIARTFLPLPEDFEYVDYTVDHIESGPAGKLNNNVENLRWVTRAENIKKAYLDGMCDDRIKGQYRPVMVNDLWVGEYLYFDSIKDAAYTLGLNQSTISHAIARYTVVMGRYVFEHAGREDILLYGINDYYEEDYDD